jgi:hypothetical protein
MGVRNQVEREASSHGEFAQFYRKAHGDIFEMIYLIEISSLPTMRPELDSLVMDFFTSLHFGLVR